MGTQTACPLSRFPSKQFVFKPRNEDKGETSRKQSPARAAFKTRVYPLNLKGELGHLDGSADALLGYQELDHQFNNGIPQSYVKSFSIHPSSHLPTHLNCRVHRLAVEPAFQAAVVSYNSCGR